MPSYEAMHARVRVYEYSCSYERAGPSSHQYDASRALPSSSTTRALPSAAQSKSRSYGSGLSVAALGAHNSSYGAPSGGGKVLADDLDEGLDEDLGEDLGDASYTSAQLASRASQQMRGARESGSRASYSGPSSRHGSRSQYGGAAESVKASMPPLSCQGGGTARGAPPSAWNAGTLRRAAKSIGGGSRSGSISRDQPSVRFTEHGAKSRHDDPRGKTIAPADSRRAGSRAASSSSIGLSTLSSSYYSHR